MTKQEKNQILKYLNNLKSYGYSYHDNFEIKIENTNSLHLSNNLNDLENSVKNCFLCELSKTRKNALFSYGSKDSQLMFLADEPSKTEDELNSFYVGKSGEMLEKMIENVLEIKKEEVYLTSLLKCHSQNRANKINFDTCKDYFFKELEIVNPKLIVILGETAHNYLLKNSDFLIDRGKFLNFDKYQTISIYSPSFLLRNPSLKKDTFHDMLKIKHFLKGD